MNLASSTIASFGRSSLGQNSHVTRRLPHDTITIFRDLEQVYFLDKFLQNVPKGNIIGFVIEVEEFHNLNPEEATRSRAAAIYKRYFSGDRKIKDFKTVSTALQKKIKSERNIPVNVFDEIESMLLNMLEMELIPKFRLSDVFKNYVRKKESNYQDYLQHLHERVSKSEVCKQADSYMKRLDSILQQEREEAEKSSRVFLDFAKPVESAGFGEVMQVNKVSFGGFGGFKSPTSSASPSLSATDIAASKTKAVPGGFALGSSTVMVQSHFGLGSATLGQNGQNLGGFGQNGHASGGFSSLASNNLQSGGPSGIMGVQTLGTAHLSSHKLSPGNLDISSITYSSSGNTLSSSGGNAILSSGPQSNHTNSNLSSPSLSKNDSDSDKQSVSMMSFDTTTEGDWTCTEFTEAIQDMRMVNASPSTLNARKYSEESVMKVYTVGQSPNSNGLVLQNAIKSNAFQFAGFSSPATPTPPSPVPSIGLAGHQLVSFSPQPQTGPVATTGGPLSPRKKKKEKIIKPALKKTNAAAKNSPAITPEAAAENERLIQSFEEILMEPTFTVISIIGEAESKRQSRDEVFDAIINISISNELTISLIKRQFQKEILDSSGTHHTNPSTLFRGESCAIKTMSRYFCMEGKQYLQSCVLPLIKQISIAGSLEVNPEKAQEGESVQANCYKLLGIAQEFLESVLRSPRQCPVKFRHLFSAVRGQMSKVFPELTQQIVGSLLFLRFICPAIISPHKYGLEFEGTIDSTTQRSLILISKLIQNLVNGVEFDGTKERYMTSLNCFIKDNQTKLQEFFQILSDEQLTIQDEQHQTGVTRRTTKNSTSLQIIYGALVDHKDYLWDCIVQRPALLSKFKNLFFLGLSNIRFPDSK
eukprot:TRINITY_DN3465_c0_g1_i1.p1 TRINITY_DN3465_c0_g1~~TRINITY_DN3465_c0_g1_i1.p1  ORF type:complete len:871 (-),score=186.52 TRINITY_DN3465_c0_g1_i1:51-2663(-)